MKKSILLFALLILFPAAIWAQGNAFSFQGKLNDGTNPANGRYDLEFKLFDAVTGGTQIGPTVLRPSTTLINGVFSTTLDFGAVAFQNPSATFVEIAVKPTGSPNALTILGPRQQLTVVPYASRAQNATVADNSTNLGGIAASEYITRTNGGADFIRNSTQPQANSNFNISGDGTVNGNLNVGGTQLIAGSQIVGGQSSVASLYSGSNVSQSRVGNGLPKALLYVQANGTIVRCYNGVTGVSTGGCGFSIATPRDFNGRYQINFPFQINDRFILVTAEQTINLSSGVNIGAGYLFFSANVLQINTFITDIDFNSSRADNPFMVVVY
jgi:hypothetical protein